MQALDFINPDNSITCDCVAVFPRSGRGLITRIKKSEAWQGRCNTFRQFHAAEQELEELWQINVMGPWRLTRAAWPLLQQSGQGRIQVLVSMSGKRVKGRMAGYPVSKFALMALCQSMRNEGWDAGIRVTAICPSWVATDMALSVSSLAPEAMTQPEDIADLSSSLLRLPNAAVPFELALNCALEI